MGIRILIVEDENEIADFVVRGLREEGFSVERAADGEEGWHHLKTGSWDVVLLDWWLPGTDGLTLLSRFRQGDQTTPVLFLTAKDAVSDRVKGLDNGADDYLCKPFAFAELLARVRVMARRRGRNHTGHSQRLTASLTACFGSVSRKNKMPTPTVHLWHNPPNPVGHAVSTELRANAAIRIRRTWYLLFDCCPERNS